MLHQRITLNTGASMDVYAPPSPVAPDKLKRSIVICPGGGYANLSLREAEPVALRFAGMGFVTFVLWYHVAPSVFPSQVQDVGTAVAHVRAHATDYYVDPDAVAVMGFSAGAHAACSLGVMWHDTKLWEPLGLSCEQVKPNAMVLGYPVITGGEYAHRGSMEHLSGSSDPADHARFSLETHVSDKTPPTFLWHTWDDQAVPVENTLLFATALRRSMIPAEVHIYPNGHHGSALCDETSDSNGYYLIPEAAEWPQHAARFLKRIM